MQAQNLQAGKCMHARANTGLQASYDILQWKCTMLGVLTLQEFANAYMRWQNNGLSGLSPSGNP